MLVQSGRPINCFGFLDGTGGTAHYANGYFSCDPASDQLPVDGAGNNGSTIVPRGTRRSHRRGPQLDLNVAYAAELGRRT